MRKLEFGAYNKLPHYSIIGEPTNFYIWANENGRGHAAKWIKGAIAFELYYKFKAASKKDFIILVKQQFSENKK